MGKTYIKESHVKRGVIFETVLCSACFAEQNPDQIVAHGRDAKGYSRLVQPYTGDVSCMQCDDTRDVKPEAVKRNPAAGIALVAVDSSNLEAVGYASRWLIIKFKTGGIYAYQDVPPATYEAFARAESKGKFYHQQIKGKFVSEKVSGKCPQCGSEPELIGEVCVDCGTAVARAIETRYPEPERYPGEHDVQTELAAMRDVVMGPKEA